jgi:AcrR family transcriptional regulator
VFVAVAVGQDQPAGVGTRGALYHHFADKRALFLAVFERVEEDLLAAAEVQRILLIDGPAVLGWQEWRATEKRFGLGVIHSLLELAVAEGTLPAQPLDAIAHVLLAAVDEAALFIASASDLSAAKEEAVTAVGHLLNGLTTAL